jgi:prepilin-type processing-associated H-X9-DG protein
LGSGTLRAYKTNYEFVVTDQELRCKHWKTVGLSVRRMFGADSDTRIADITDGTANTLAMGELTSLTHNGMSPGWAFRGWVQIGIDPMGGWNTTIPARGLNIRNYNGTQVPFGSRATWYNPASTHPGGVNFVFGDGAVRFINETIDTSALTSLCTMAGGEIYNLE